MEPKRNLHIIFISRPGISNEPEEKHFACVECPYPEGDLQKGQVLIKTCYLSVDPYLRCLMNEDPGFEYASPWIPGERIIGSSGVGVIVKSNHPDFATGDLITATTGWPWVIYFVQDLSSGNSAENQFQKLDKKLFGKKPSLGLSFVVGLTALIGLWEKGHVTKGANQTLVVSGAAGATGSLAGQMGRLLGCSRVVGICGRDEKCSWITGDLGFDGAVNYNKENVAERLKELCPSGIDIYFDNVGGSISEAVIRQMNSNSHIVLCGQISTYNKDVPYPPPLPPDVQKILNDRNIKRERFLVLCYKEHFEKAIQQLMEWILSGQIKYRETVAEGLENTAQAFVSMMRGGNIGKQIVHVSDVEVST